MLLITSVLLATGVALAADEGHCGQHHPNQKAVIVVSVDAGVPSVDPTSCTVAPGTRIVWKAPVDSVFEVVFTAGTPDESGAMKIKSQASANEQRITMKTKRPDTLESYAYDVFLDGEMVDPVVIIDPTL